mgnify:CR=1 FL=1
MANFGWKFGAVQEAADCEVDPTALWVAPIHLYLYLMAIFSIPYSDSLVWVIDSPTTASFS